MAVLSFNRSLLVVTNRLQLSPQRERQVFFQCAQAIVQTVLSGMQQRTRSCSWLKMRSGAPHACLLEHCLCQKLLHFSQIPQWQGAHGGCSIEKQWWSPLFISYFGELPRENQIGFTEETRQLLSVLAIAFTLAWIPAQEASSLGGVLSTGKGS